MDLHTLPFTFVQPSEGETVFLGSLTATVKIPSTATDGPSRLSSTPWRPASSARPRIAISARMRSPMS